MMKVTKNLNVPFSIDSLSLLLLESGAHQYGREPVSQLEHALQCASWAEKNNVKKELITAALLHDLGHLLHEFGDESTILNVDDKHEYRAIHHLKTLFPNALIEPIKMHVDAKRYLCFKDEAYYASLSPASKASLALQGGVFNEIQALEFLAKPYSQDAIALRIWDDLSKVPGALTPDLEHFIAIMKRCVKLKN